MKTCPEDDTELVEEVDATPKIHYEHYLPTKAYFLCPKCRRTYPPYTPKETKEES